MADFAQGRAYFDSLHWLIGPAPKVEIQATSKDQPRGHWFIPHTRSSESVMLFSRRRLRFLCGYNALIHHHVGGKIRIAIFTRLSSHPGHPHPLRLTMQLPPIAFCWIKELIPSRLIVGGGFSRRYLMLTLQSSVTWVYHNPSLVLASVRGQIPDHAAQAFWQRPL